jgi:hypothetical protein
MRFVAWMTWPALFLFGTRFSATTTIHDGETYVHLPAFDVWVRGFIPWGNATRVFLGIPYAKAPLGDVRWRPPVPWTPPPDASSIDARSWAANFMQDESVRTDSSRATAVSRV